MSVPALDPPVTPTPLTSVYLRLGIIVAPPYADIVQAPYPPPSIYKAGDLELTARDNGVDIRQATSLRDFISYKQRRTLGALPEAVSHPAATLLWSYMEEGIPANIGPPWLRSTLDETISNGLHVSACAPDMVSFIQGELQWQIHDGFSILLSVDDNVQVFGKNLKYYCIAAVPQDQHFPHLILNFLAQPDKENPCVNDTTDREIAP